MSKPFQHRIDAPAGVRIPTGAGAGKVAVSNANGDIEWTSAVARAKLAPPARPSDLWMPTGAKAQNSLTGRLAGTATGANLVSGELYLAGGLVLTGGETYTSITFCSHVTGATSPTNQWFCLVDQALNVLAKTDDNTTTAWPANTAKTLGFPGGLGYTPSADIAVYAGIVVVAATVPTLSSNTNTGPAPTLLTPYMGAKSTTGLTTPASLGATAGALTSFLGVAYVFVS